MKNQNCFEALFILISSPFSVATLLLLLFISPLHSSFLFSPISCSSSSFSTSCFAAHLYTSYPFRLFTVPDSPTVHSLLFSFSIPFLVHFIVSLSACQTSVDMVFLLDESGSVGASNFGKVKQFVQKVIDFFNVGKTGTHIAVETYSTQTTRHFYLNSYFTKSELRNAVSKIVFKGGWTYTGEALDIVRTYVLNEKYGMRTDPGIPKVLVLLTDGKSNGKGVLDPANALRNQGVNIFSIGVGSGVSKAELNLIASDPDKDYVFELTSFNDLSSWVDRLSSVSCSGRYCLESLYIGTD